MTALFPGVEREAAVLLQLVLLHLRQRVLHRPLVQLPFAGDAAEDGGTSVVAFSDDQELLLTGSGDRFHGQGTESGGTVQLWRVDTGQCVLTRKNMGAIVLAVHF